MAGVGWPKGKKRGPRKPRDDGGSIGGNASVEPSGVEGASDAPAIAVTAEPGSTVVIDPVAAVAAGTGASDHSDGGKPRSAKRGRKKKASQSSVGAIETLLYSVHMMGASFLDIEEIALEESEAKNLAVAIGRVSEHYDGAPGMSEVTAAWVNLGMVAGMTYGTRVVAYRARKAMEPKQNAGLSGGLM